jgi:hypothetical protein
MREKFIIRERREAKIAKIEIEMRIIGKLAKIHPDKTLKEIREGIDDILKHGKLPYDLEMSLRRIQYSILQDPTLDKFIDKTLVDILKILKKELEKLKKRSNA